MPETESTAQGNTAAADQGSQAGSQTDAKAATTTATDAKASETAAATDAKTATTQSTEQQGEKPGDGGEKAGDAKSETKPDAKTAPETYDLKLPEGSPLDKAEIDKVSALAKEKNLSNEQAQLLLDQRSEAVLAERQRGQATLSEARTKWDEACTSDKEFGGEALQGNLDKYAKPALDKFFSAEFKKLLAESGYGSHPELVRGLVRIGKAMAEDRPPESSGTGAGKKSIAERLYGN